MPGDKSIYNNNYITEEVAYRTAIAAADVEPPDPDVIETISFLVAGPGTVAACRIGATNTLFAYLLLDGAGMTITPRLWRFVEGVAYEATPADWAAVNQSTMLTALNLSAGDYAITLTGVFNGSLCHIAEQHTE